MPSRNPTPGYESVVSGGLTFAGVDQGIDFTGTGTIHAIADGIIEKLVPSGSGWPGRGALLVYRITSGPGKGQRVYVAEDFTPAGGLRTNSAIRKGQVLGSVHSSYPGIEMGFAKADGSPVAPLNPNPHSPKAAGHAFDAFVRGVAGAPGNLATDLGTAAAAQGDPTAAGCASTVVMLLGTIGAAAGMLYATGGWPF